MICTIHDAGDSLFGDNAFPGDLTQGHKAIFIRGLKDLVTRGEIKVLSKVPFAQPLHAFSMYGKTPTSSKKENVRINFVPMGLCSLDNLRENRAIEEQLH